MAHFAAPDSLHPIPCTPPQFTRSSSKYWVHPSHLLRVQLLVLRHMPVLVYGARAPEGAGNIASPEALREGARGVSGLISSGVGGWGA